MKLDDREADLLQMVGALDSAACFPGALDRGQEQADERCDDGDHDEEFYEREPAGSTGSARHGEPLGRAMKSTAEEKPEV
jgi:hypothetical protein